MVNALEKRFWEVDALRGVAILMMVWYHFLFDLSYLGGYDINVYTGLWRYWARATATIFIFLVGLSLCLSLARIKQLRPGNSLFRRYLRRGLRIFGWGLSITVVTGLLFPQGTVYFGILHFIGLAVILAYPFLRWRLPNLILGLVALGLGFYLQGLTVDFPWLLWLGLRPESFYTFDYFPIFPWFGVTLMGIFVGNWLYAGYRRRFPLPEVIGQNWALRFLGFLGQHSLTIYLLHQPALVALLTLLGVVRPGL